MGLTKLEKARSGAEFAASRLTAESRLAEIALEDRCIWCSGTGFVSETGVMCRTCHGSGRKNREVTGG
jgi:DnaJ-class molecular chaperone